MQVSVKNGSSNKPNPSKFDIDKLPSLWRFFNSHSKYCQHLPGFPDRPSINRLLLKFWNFTRQFFFKFYKPVFESIFLDTSKYHEPQTVFRLVDYHNSSPICSNKAFNTYLLTNRKCKPQESAAGGGEFAVANEKWWGNISPHRCVRIRLYLRLINYKDGNICDERPLPFDTPSIIFRFTAFLTLPRHSRKTGLARRSKKKHTHLMQYSLLYIFFYLWKYNTKFPMQ